MTWLHYIQVFPYSFMKYLYSNNEYEKVYKNIKFILIKMGSHTFALFCALRLIHAGNVLQIQTDCRTFIDYDLVMWTFCEAGIIDSLPAYAGSMFPIFQIYMDYLFYYQFKNFRRAIETFQDFITNQEEFYELYPEVKSKYLVTKNFYSQITLLIKIFTDFDKGKPYKNKLSKWTNIEDHLKTKINVILKFWDYFASTILTIIGSMFLILSLVMFHKIHGEISLSHI